MVPRGRVFFGFTHIPQACLNIPATLLPPAGPCHTGCGKLTFHLVKRSWLWAPSTKDFKEENSLDFRWWLISKCPFYSKMFNASFYKAPTTLQNGTWGGTRDVKPCFEIHVLGMRIHKFPSWSWSSPFHSHSSDSSVLYSWTCSGIISKIPSFLFLFNFRFHGDAGKMSVN